MIESIIVFIFFSNCEKSAKFLSFIVKNTVFRNIYFRMENTSLKIPSNKQFNNQFRIYEINIKSSSQITQFINK